MHWYFNTINMLKKLYVYTEAIRRTLFFGFAKFNQFILTNSMRATHRQHYDADKQIPQHIQYRVPDSGSHKYRTHRIWNGKIFALSMSIIPYHSNTIDADNTKREKNQQERRTHFHDTFRMHTHAVHKATTPKQLLSKAICEYPQRAPIEGQQDIHGSTKRGALCIIRGHVEYSEPGEGHEKGQGQEDGDDEKEHAEPAVTGSNPQDCGDDVPGPGWQVPRLLRVVVLDILMEMQYIYIYINQRLSLTWTR